MAALLAGTLWGLALGALPGVTGLTALILALPFATMLDPIPGLILLIAIHAVADTGGAISAITLAIPGTPSNAATVEDGNWLARHGQARRAIAASAFASALGGILGFLLLVAALPFSLWLIRQAGAPEILTVSILGLFSAARFGGGRLHKGFFAVAMGIFAGLIGTRETTGEPRLWFGIEGLYDGLALMAVATGLFAGPEMIRLIGARTGTPVLAEEKPGWRSAGFSDVLSRPVLLLKASVVGWLVGLMPGVGGSVSGFLSYAWAGVQTAEPRDAASRRSGVIAAEAGNNAKEGGDLIPTLTLGLPGGAGMAILLGAFASFGLSPSPTFAVDYPEVISAIAMTLLVANILGGLLVVFGSAAFLALLRIPTNLFAPIVAVLGLAAIATLRNEVMDIWTTAFFAAIGVAMIAKGYSRPAFLIGFILAPVIETYGAISFAAYGWSFLLRPFVLGAFVLCLILAFAGFRRRASGT